MQLLPGSTPFDPPRGPQITNHYDEALLPCFADVLPRMQALASLNLSNFDLVNTLLASVSPCKPGGKAHALSRSCAIVLPGA